MRFDGHHLSSQNFQYEPLEAFGEGLTTKRPWNKGSLGFVERLNGRVAMLGFMAAIIGELISGHGPAGQVADVIRWYLSL
jgi:hypothetical protein|tara:strand:- start:654 stop:893 length:240 start_codon:yes stop_codon:yes gene_type:complete